LPWTAISSADPSGVRRATRKSRTPRRTTS
jgi:hypothetical protein